MKYVFILLLGIVLGYLGNNLLNGNKDITKTVEKIDTIYNSRTDFLKDTIYVQKKIIVNHFDTVSSKVDSVFSGKDSTKKQSMFDSVYFSKDTLKNIDISSDQAKQAIEVKILWIRDSSLLDLCEKNVAQCDGTLVKIKTEVDSLNGVKIPENHNLRNFICGLSAGLVLGIFGTVLSK